MLKKISFKKRYISFSILAFAIALVALVFAFSGKNVDTESYVKKTETKSVEKAKKTSKVSVTSTKKEESKTTTSSSSQASAEKAPTHEETEAAKVATVEAQAAPAAEVYQVEQLEPTDQVQQHAAAPATYQANGNTAGAVGSQAAAQMAAATGVSQATWEAIIARESNGDPNVANASGASGLFQTMPGWGSTATVQDQVNAAVRAYRSQGLSAWGY
ncbi:transglycosylase SLT domain-containing protein [Streptococcus catagoni]|uniref:transglycosylase SLT domain-containing protein n=1 Tax=Streptococcus catagoni TaxID=2654874 RepID=UPI00140BBF28|nr:transglycosylase SLT domain-containing protein [Streptococcus catagoni]